MPAEEAEWSDVIGLRRAIASLALRALCVLPLWIGAIWAMNLLINALTASVFLLLMAGVVSGFVLGIIMSRGLSEQAGMVSAVVSVLAATATAAVLLVGWIIMQQFGVSWSGATLFYFVGETAMMSLALIVRYTALDD
jgi:hypothetical protein